MGSSVGDDHHAPSFSRLRDRLADQCAHVITTQLFADSRRTTETHGPGLAAALRDRFEDSRDPRLASLLVRHLPRVDPRLRRRPGDYLLVDVEEAQSLGHKSADLFAAPTRRVRDAHTSARHGP